VIQNCEELTILIPTIDRPQFIARALFVYSELGFNGQILIGDSSQGDAYEHTKSFIETLPSAMSVKHIYLSSKIYPTCGAVVRELISSVQTRFVCQFGDDDILLPMGASECIDFLARTPSYGAATGRQRLEFILDRTSSEAHLVSEFELTEEPDLDHLDPVVRFKTYMRNTLAPSYYIFRREVFERAYSPLNLVETRYFGPELLVSSVAVCLSRVKKLDVLTIMFEVHDDHIFSWHKTSCYDLFFDKGFSYTLRIFRQEVGRALSQESTHIEADAIDIVDKELFRHISKLLGWQYKQRYANNDVKNPGPNRNPGESLVTRMINYIVGTSLRKIYWDCRKGLRVRSRTRVRHTMPDNQLFWESSKVCELFRKNSILLRGQ
jgi:glycosyltransferase domain-containing protein